MTNNSTVRKVMQVSEEAAPAVHIPILVGNEKFVLTQQDIRRVEDIRMLTYNRLAPNGQFYPVDLSLTALEPYSLPTTSNFCTLDDLIARSLTKRVKLDLNKDPGENEKLSTKAPCPILQQIPCRTVASVSTQLGWSKIKAESDPVFPLRYSSGTSTCGLMSTTQTQTSSIKTQPSLSPRPNPIGKKESPGLVSCQTQTSPSQTSIVKKEPKNSTCQTQPITTSTGCNTSASHLMGKITTESYVSDVSEYTSEEETTHPCPRCKSQQTCTEHDLIVQQQRPLLTPRCPLEQPCTSRQIHFDFCSQEGKSCTQQMNKLQKQEDQGFYRTVPLSRSLYKQTLSKAPDSKPRKTLTYDLKGPIEINPNYEELVREHSKKDSAHANKQL
uniref:Uncharacterized protein LOC108052516 n=1 Tax=Drosophila rhopaloa TaxID=1041015 RepID=A0A6P4FLU7_DRORH